MTASHVFRPGEIVRVRGESWVVDRHVAGTQGSVLDVCGRGPGNRGARASFLLPYESVERLPSPDTPRIVRPSTWRRLARSIIGDATPSYGSLRAPARAALTVLPFQLEPVLAIVRGRAARILIADDVGLGKTVQASLVIRECLERRPESHILIVTPAGLRHQWQTELQDRFALDAALIDSSSLARHSAQGNGNPWAIPGVVLTSLDYVKRPEVVRSLEALVWDVVVFDEAHALAGRSDRATAAAMLAQRARTVVLLTATPHSGDDHAFARLTALGDISRRFPLLVFRRTRFDVGMDTSRRTVSLRVHPTPHETEMHGALMTYARLVWTQSSPTAPGARLAMGVLARRASSCAWSLARSLETRLRLLSVDRPPALLQLALPFDGVAADDESPIGELSQPGLSDAGEERRWLEHVLQLAQQASDDDSKTEALRRLLRRAREPAIVFTEYRDTLRRLAEHLRDHAPVLLHGGMSAGDRHEALRQFASGEARLLLATDAASEGLNLHQRCRLVINLELPWTPVRLEQRIGRVERLGQTRRVHAVHLLAAGTCEEESVAVVLARMRRAASVLGTMRGAVGEQHVARLVIGRERDDPRVEPAAVPPGLLVGNLRLEAVEEAARLEQVRTLVAARGHAPVDSRPCITVITCRRARPVSHWLYRVIVEDPELRPLWMTVIGVRDEARVGASAHELIRRRVEWFRTAVEPAVESAAGHLLADFVSALEPSRALAAERERAIADGLRHQRARLAASLLQPGLFDRRAERAAAAQDATLNDALDRCAERLDDLVRLGAVSIERRLVLGRLSR